MCPGERLPQSITSPKMIAFRPLRTPVKRSRSKKVLGSKTRPLGLSREPRKNEKRMAWRSFLLLALCLFSPTVGHADVYKWVDEHSVVNYGDRPPPSVKGARPLSSTAGSPSVVPGIPKEELARLREDDAHLRLQQLEREVQELRAQEAARAAMPVAERSEPDVFAYPVYGYHRKWHKRPNGDWKPRPPSPIAKPRPGGRPPLPSESPYMLLGR